MEVKRKDDMEEEGVLSRGEARWLRSILWVYLHGVMIGLGEHVGRKQWGWQLGCRGLRNEWEAGRGLE